MDEGARSGDSVANDDVLITDNALVTDDALVTDNALISDDAMIDGDAPSNDKAANEGAINNEDPTSDDDRYRAVRYGFVGLTSGFKLQRQASFDAKYFEPKLGSTIGLKLADSYELNLELGATSALGEKLNSRFRHESVDSKDRDIAFSAFEKIVFENSDAKSLAQ